MRAEKQLPFGVKPNCPDWADMPERLDNRRVYIYCIYGEGNDGQQADYHSSESEARAAAWKAVVDGDTTEADIWWESVTARWVPARWTTEDGYHHRVAETNEWEYEHDNAGSICAFTKDGNGVVVERGIIYAWILSTIRNTRGLHRKMTPLTASSVGNCPAMRSPYSAPLLSSDAFL